MIETPAHLRRMRLGQYRERELLSRKELLITALGFLAATAILLLAAGCKTPSCAQLTQARDLACKTNAQACEAAQQALDAAYPSGCPTPEPTVPPVTQPSPTPTPEPTAPPTPPVAGCVLAGEPRTPLPGYKATLGEQVNAVMLALKPECQYAGGTCLLGDETRQHWQARVEEALRAKGICAGQHTPSTDEIAVARVSSEPWEGYHVFSGDDTNGPVPPGGARRTVVWYPQNYRDAWMPPVASSACPEPRPESYHNPATKQDCTYTWGLKPGRQWIDATLNVQRCCEFCKAIGMGEFNGQMRCTCPLRPEGNPERFACEAEVGAVWEIEGGGTLLVNPSNPAQATCDGCRSIRVCTKSGACSDWIAP